MIPEHRHSFFHYIYFLSGKASVTVGEEKLLAGARTLVLVSPNTSHSILGVELACSIDVKFSCSPALQETLMTLPGFLPALGNYEDSLLRGIFEEAVGQQEHFDELINLRLYELLILLLRSQHLCQSYCQEMIFAAGTAVSDPQMRKILAYIEANIRRPLRVTELAEVFGYNKNYFQSLFKKLIGIRAYLKSQSNCAI